MDLPTDIDALVALLIETGWDEEVHTGSRDFPTRLLRNRDGVVFEARRSSGVWRASLDRGDGWRKLEDLAEAAGIESKDAFGLSGVPGARTASLAYQSMPQSPYVRWETLVPRCVEWLSAAPPAPTQAAGDVLGALGQRDFHQACLSIIDRRTHGLHLRPMPAATSSDRRSPVDLLRWLRRSEVHDRIRWAGGDHLLSESSGLDRPGSIGGESQMVWVAYLDDPGASPDPEVVIHDHLHDDWVRGEILASMPLSQYLFGCLVAPSDFHSSWSRPDHATPTESVWSEGTKPFTVTLGATWIQLQGGSLLVDDPAQAAQELGTAAELRTLFEWGTRTA